MTYVVTDTCIACKYTDCVEVCPVVYEAENMLVIHPDEWTAGSASRSARPMRSVRTPSPT